MKQIVLIVDIELIRALMYSNENVGTFAHENGKRANQNQLKLKLYQVKISLL